MSTTWYILGDADRVRERIEAALFSHDMALLTQISMNLTQAIATLVDHVVERLAAKVIMAGGDDVLFTAAGETFDLRVLEEVAQNFSDQTSCTISFGVGASPDEAYLHLRRAKASGGGVISVGAGR